MKVRGVVLSVLLASMLGATDFSHPDLPHNDTEELLQKLFEGIDSQGDVYPHVNRVIDLEDLLEDYPELEEQYTSLSADEKVSLVETIEEYNERIAEILLALLNEADLISEDEFPESSDESIEKP